MENNATSTPRLGYGYRDYPTDTPAAWGARWIITQDGMIDQVWDRCDAVGRREDKDRLFHRLGNEPHSHRLGELARHRLTVLLRNGDLSTRSDEVVTLVGPEDSSDVRVIGSPNASAGYFYVTAYLVPEEKVML